MRRNSIVFAVLLMSVFLGGCMVAKPADMSSESPTTTVEGVLTVTADRAVLNSNGKKY